MAADMEGLEWNDGWSDDDGFEVDPSLLSLNNFKSPRDDDNSVGRDQQKQQQQQQQQQQQLSRNARSDGGTDNNANDKARRVAAASSPVSPVSESFSRYRQPAVMVPALLMKARVRSFFF